jgi:cobalamin biosynthesis Mg chelatase CobN
MMLRAPDLARVANREIRRDLRARLGLVKGAKDATPAATATAAGAAAASSAAAAASSGAAAASSGAATASSGATAASSGATATAAPTSSSSAAATGGEGGRGERETSNQQSRAQRGNETAALLAIELKKSAHRWILRI